MKTLIRKAHSVKLRPLGGREIIAVQDEPVELPDAVAEELLRTEPDNWEDPAGPPALPIVPDYLEGEEE